MRFSEDGESMGRDTGQGWGTFHPAVMTFPEDKEEEKSGLLRSHQVVTGCPRVPSSCSTGGDR